MLWSRGLQGLWRMEGNGDDSSGNGRNATPTGVSAVAAQFGRGYYFDGAGYLTLPAFALSGTALVFSTWCRVANDAGANQNLLGEGVTTLGFLAVDRLQNTTTLRWTYRADAGIVTETVAGYFDAPYNDAWLHLAVVCDYSGEVVYFYRNGVLVASPALGANPVFPTTSRVRYLGAWSTTSSQLDEGYMDEAALLTFAGFVPGAAWIRRVMLGLSPVS